VLPDKRVADHQLGRVSEFGRRRRRSCRLFNGLPVDHDPAVSQRMPADLKTEALFASGHKKV
jgi:hypothetical protein